MVLGARPLGGERLAELRHALGGQPVGNRIEVVFGLVEAGQPHPPAVDGGFAVVAER